MATIHKFTDEQFQTIQSALNAAIGMALRFDQSMIPTMSGASSMMDDVANEEGEFKPFSTYPEDREKLLKLAETVEKSYSDDPSFIDAADALADLVKAILTDEETWIDKGDGPAPEEQSLSEAIGLGIGGRGVAEY